MASIDHADALRSVQSIIEREFKPRPGRASAFAPNGEPYIKYIMGRANTASEAVQAFGAELRSLVGEHQGDTVWWRTKPHVWQEEASKTWTVSARLALGYAKDERTEFMPNDENAAAYPGDGQEAGAAVPGQSRLYRKKPVVVAAVQLTGFDDMKAIGDHFGSFHNWHSTDQGVVIVTREGSMLASIGDWIIKGVAGEFYPCKPDIFAATYEPVP